MSDDRWLKELAQVKRDEQNRLGERWDRLSGDGLTPEEEAELRALAEASEETRDAYEAFRPLGADFHARVVQAVQAQAKAEAAAAEPSAKVLRFPKRLAAWSAAAAALAAAVLVLVLRPQAAPLPVYAADEVVGIQYFRGEADPPTATPVFLPGTLLTVTARPAQAVKGPVEARAFAVRNEEEWVPLVEPQVGNGIARLQGTLGQEIRLAPGVWRIWIAVGRKGKIPRLDELAEEVRAGRTRHDHWQAVFKDIRVEDHPPQ